MYIKFLRSYGEDKKDEASAKLSPESKLSVELEGGKGKQTEGNTRLYRAACFVLTITSLILLLIVIILSVKFETGSTACPEGKEASTQRKGSEFAPTCTYEQCQAYSFHSITQPKSLGCRQCADGWLTFGKSCFFMSTFRLSWDESQRNCSARGGSLAVVSSPEIQNFLTTKGKVTYWIGLRHIDNSWNWVNNTVLGKSYWAEVAPQPGCGILISRDPPEKNWITANCQGYTYFICQLHM